MEKWFKTRQLSPSMKKKCSREESSSNSPSFSYAVLPLHILEYTHAQLTMDPLSLMQQPSCQFQVEKHCIPVTIIIIYINHSC